MTTPAATATAPKRQRPGGENKVTSLRVGVEVTTGSHRRVVGRLSSIREGFGWHLLGRLARPALLGALVAHERQGATDPARSGRQAEQDLDDRRQLGAAIGAAIGAAVGGVIGGVIGDFGNDRPREGLRPGTGTSPVSTMSPILTSGQGVCRSVGLAVLALRFGGKDIAEHKAVTGNDLAGSNID
jgi:hypothetical protein